MKWGLPFLRKTPQLTREQSLNAIPLRNTMVGVEMDEDSGEAHLLIPRSEARWVRLLSKMFYIPKQKKITLDALGTSVWELCDGKNTVRDIIDRFAAQHKLARKEAELSLVAFFRQMAKKRLIGFALVDAPKAAAEPPAKGKLHARKRKRSKAVRS